MFLVCKCYFTSASNVSVATIVVTCLPGQNEKREGTVSTFIFFASKYGCSILKRNFSYFHILRQFIDGSFIISIKCFVRRSPDSAPASKNFPQSVFLCSFCRFVSYTKKKTLLWATFFADFLQTWSRICSGNSISLIIVVVTDCNVNFGTQK